MKFITSICSLFLIPLSLFGQINVRGTITDEITETPLVGVTVLVEGTQIGTTTDANGYYILDIPESVPQEFKLQVSYLGYETRVSTVRKREGIIYKDFQLEENVLQLQTFIVSARRTDESLQDVPVSVSVLTPQQLQRSGAFEFRDYASSIPNLSFAPQGGGIANDGRTSNQITIRGISGKSTTAVYLDETPLPETVDPRIVDISRVEVLRGPQGTLYGSSSMGGAVKIVTNKANPNRLEGNLTTTVGFVNEGDVDYGVQGVINIPLVKDKLALRAVGFYDFESGVYDRRFVNGTDIINLNPTLSADAAGNPISIMTDGCPNCNTNDQENIDDETNYGIQGALAYYPSDDIAIYAKVIHQDQSGDAYDFADGDVDNFTQFRASGVPEFFEDQWTHYSLVGEIDFGIGDLIASTSYLDRTYLEQEDEGEFLSALLLGYPTATNAFWASTIQRGADFDKFVQEFRFRSRLEGRLNFSLGAFYTSEESAEAGFSDLPGIVTFLLNPSDPATAAALEQLPFFVFDGRTKIQELAFFGEAYFDITEKLTFTAGLRYFNAEIDRVNFATGFPLNFDVADTRGVVSDDGINPKFNLTYKIDNNSLLYATVARGFRLGGINDVVPAVFCAADLAALGTEPPTAFRSDFLWNYELGFKGTLFDGRIIANTAVFFTDWNDLQQVRRLPCGFGFTSNVGGAQSYGFEAEITAKVMKGLDLGLGIGYIETEITQVGEGLNAEVGDGILFTPNLTASANLQYTYDIDFDTRFYFTSNVQYAGERTSSFTPELAPERVFDPYTLVNMRTGISFPLIEVNVFATNVFNTQANFGDVISLAAETPGRPRYQTNRPRTIGLQTIFYLK